MKKDLELEELPIAENWEDFYIDKETLRWSFQKQIVTSVNEYLINPYQNKELKASLVKMPTGTGKTAIMALITNYLLPTKNVLIIVPSAALKRQNCYYLDTKHWIKTNKRPKNIKQSTFFHPKDFVAKIAKYDDLPINLVCTTKTICDLKYDNKYDNEYKLLKNKIDIIFVDEGHTEPAKKWSVSVRELQKPTILFSATPYRNDRRFFNIGNNTKKQQFIYEITYQEALEKNSIRNIEFHNPQRSYYQLSENKVRSEIKHESFLNSFISFFLEQILKKDFGLKEPKAIIRCSTLEDINILLDFFNTKSYSFDFSKFGILKGRNLALGIHERLSNDKNNHSYDSVDNAIKEDNNTIFWIHQNKLLEGIDDENFFIVGFCNPYFNGRGLIQQIGRILRNPINLNCPSAFVFSDENFELEKQWNGYKAYEKSKNKIIGTEQIVERIIDNFPDYFYFDRKFSKITNYKFDREEFEELVNKDLNFPKITNIYKYARENIDLKEDLLIPLCDELEDNDIIKIVADTQLNQNNAINIGVFVGWKISPSDLLRDSVFFDISLVCYTLFSYKNYLFFRGNINLNSYIPNNLIYPLEPSKIQKLLSSPDLKIKQIAVVNSDSNTSAVRRRLEGAQNIIDTAPYLNDHLQAVTTAVANINDMPRYVGITKSRVTDDRGVFLSLDHYVEWIKKIVSEIDDIKTKHPFFSRYADYVDAPQNAIPAHILIDFTNFVERFEIYEGENKTTTFPESFCEISEDVTYDENEKCGYFNLKILDDEFEIKIKYYKRKFKLEPSSKKDKELIDRKYIDKSLNDEDEDARKKKAVDFIKNYLVYKIITKDGSFYTDNTFFKPSIPLWGQKRLEHLGLIKGFEELEVVEQEKEIDSSLPTNDSNDFQDKTLFKFIEDNKKREEPFCEFDGLLCDDGHGELADFVGYSKTNRKVVFIHAKMAKSEKTLSAVSFDDVSSQVIKNLRTFDPYNFSDSDIVTNWNTKLFGKYERLRVGVDLETFRSELFELLRKGANREVWIVYGKGFSAKELFNELNKEDPIYYAKHLVYSMLNCNEAVSRFAANLKIFTCP